MSFCWKSGDLEFNATHRGMARIRVALGDVLNVLDGPAHPGQAYRWLLASEGRNPQAPSVRVLALRSNDGRLNAAECELIANLLRRVVAEPKLWAMLLERVTLEPEVGDTAEALRAFLLDFATFCERAGSQGGAREGLGLEPDRWGIERPAFFAKPGGEERLALHFENARAGAKQHFGEELSFDEPGIEALERISRAGVPEALAEEDAPRPLPVSLGLFYLEALRRLHGGEWGRTSNPDTGIPAVQLKSGVVVHALFWTSHFAPAGQRPFGLDEFARRPLQLPS